ncbi:coil containing protein [Vibrio phage 1.170.O._10N.261.52.C3]|nr:coil containing protein [Vibrio phage 1.170.O._10N.261.52.C3]
MEKNIFAEVVKKGLMFTTSRGTLSPQDVWSLPLTGNNGFNLDEVSKALLKKVRDSEEESLVSTPSKASESDVLLLEVLKFIIEDKKGEIEEAKSSMERKAKRDRLLALKAKKQGLAEEELSMEEIENLLKDLD